jgi:hypothetical protein
LVQGENLEISRGDKPIPQSPPLAIYSPEILTIKSEEEDYVFPPAIQVEELIVVESSLLKEEILYLHSRYAWNQMWEHFRIEDYIRYTLVLLQLIIFPVAISGCYFTLKQRKILDRLKRHKPKGKKKENYKNTKYFLEKMYGDDK